VDESRGPWLNLAHVDQPDGPTLVDRGFQLAFKVAHRMLRAYWTVRRPHTHGSLIALWYEGKILLVKNSYRHDYTLPGGYVRRGEPVSVAAARELAEECEIAVDPREIKQVYAGVHDYEHRQDDVTISEVTVDRAPKIAVDHREVVWAGFKSREEALAMPIVPHLREYLQSKA
jgi:ADP-ribose pyrophosphatase YjhB (NUDIX family)